MSQAVVRCNDNEENTRVMNIDEKFNFITFNGSLESAVAIYKMLHGEDLFYSEYENEMTFGKIKKDNRERKPHLCVKRRMRDMALIPFSLGVGETIGINTYDDETIIIGTVLK